MFLCPKQTKRIDDGPYILYCIRHSSLLSRLQPGRTMSSVEAVVQLRHYPATKIQRCWRKHANVRVQWSFELLNDDGRLKGSLLLPKRHLNNGAVECGKCPLCEHSVNRLDGGNSNICQYRMLCVRKGRYGVAVPTCDAACPGNRVCVSCQRKHIQASLGDTTSIVACAYCRKPFSACVLIAKNNDGIEMPLEVTIHSCGKSSHVSEKAVEAEDCDVGDSVFIVNDKMFYTDEAKEVKIVGKGTTDDNEKVYTVDKGGRETTISKSFGDKIYARNPGFAFSERKQQMCALLAGNNLELDANEMEGEEKDAHKKLLEYAALLSLMGWDSDPLNDALIADMRTGLVENFLCLDALPFTFSFSRNSNSVIYGSNLPPNAEMKAVARELDDILSYAKEKEREWNAFSFVPWKHLSFELAVKLDYARKKIDKIFDMEEMSMFLLTLANNIIAVMETGSELYEDVQESIENGTNPMATNVRIYYEENCRERYFVGAEHLANDELRRRVESQFDISLNSYKEDGFSTVVECSLKDAEKICTRGMLPIMIAANVQETFNRILQDCLRRVRNDDSDDDSDDEAASSSVLGKRERA